MRAIDVVQPWSSRPGISGRCVYESHVGWFSWHHGLSRLLQSN